MDRLFIRNREAVDPHAEPRCPICLAPKSQWADLHRRADPDTRFCCQEHDFIARRIRRSHRGTRKRWRSPAIVKICELLRKEHIKYLDNHQLQAMRRLQKSVEKNLS